MATLAPLRSTAEEKGSLPPAPRPLPPCFSLNSPRELETICWTWVLGHVEKNDVEQ